MESCAAVKPHGRALLAPTRYQIVYTFTPAASNSTNCLATRGLRPPGKRLPLDEQLVAGHLHAVLLGKLQQNGIVAVFVRLLERHRQAEPRCQAHQLLAGIGCMQVVAIAVVHAFLDQMTAVAGGVDRHIVAAPADAALQDRFQRGKVVVVGREAQIVDEQDELQRVFRQLVHQGGDLVQLVLLHFDQAQAVGCKLVGNGLDRARFARAGVAVQQYIVGGLAIQQGAGVGNDFFALPLIAGQLAQALRIRVAHRHKVPVLDGKHMVAGKHAVTLLAHGRAARLVGGFIVCLGGRLPARQKGRGLGAQVVQRSGAQLLQKFKFVFQRLFQHRPGVPASGGAQAEVFILQHGIQQNLSPVGALQKEDAFKRSHRAGQIGSIRCQSGAQSRERRGRKQAAEYDQPVHTGGPIFTLHNILSSFPKETYTLSINVTAKSCKISTKKLDNPGKVRYSLTQIEMLGWEVSNRHAPYRELPVGARQKGEQAAN